jgi:ribosomal protein L29
MKVLIYNDLVQKSIKELVALRSQMKKEIYEMNMQNSLRALKQTHLISVAKKNVARINTALYAKLKEQNGNNR